MVLSNKEEKAKKEADKLALKLEVAESYKQQKQDELKREIVAHSVARKKLDKHWHETMLQIKEPIFRKEIEKIRCSFERILDKKDHLIDILMHFKNLADQQYQRTICSYCERVDSVINNFLANIESLNEKNNEQSAKNLEQAKNEKISIPQRTKNAEKYLQLLSYKACTAADDRMWAQRGETLVKKEEEINTFSAMREDLVALLENSNDGIWCKYMATLKAYVASASQNQKHVRRLRRKQNTMAHIIATQSQEIIRSEAMITRLQVELTSYQSNARKDSSCVPCAQHIEACKRLKGSLKNGTDKDKRQLANLVNASNISVDWLEAAIKKNEKILRMAALCRKFETLHEKTLPYGLTMPDTVVQANAHVLPIVSQKNSYYLMLTGPTRSTYSLAKFWQRMQTAELSKKALHREKKLLEKENAKLMRKVDESEKENVTFDASQCPCTQDLSKRSHIHQPHAVDGTSEAKKLFRI